MREKAIKRYHELLASDPALTADLFARLEAEMSARRLIYGTRSLGISLRPHFLSRKQYDLLTYASETLARVFDKVTEAILADAHLLNAIGLNDLERRLAIVDPGFSCSTINTRLDAFVYGDEVRFVEYNAENPSSLTDQSGLNEVLFNIQALETLAEQYRLRQFTPAASLLDALLETYREWGGAGVPNVAILDWPDLPTAGEFTILRNYFVGAGVPTIICAPDELEYSAGKLIRGDFRIDLVYKRIIIHEFLTRYDETHALARAYENHDVCIVNPFRCKIPHKKACFELLTDDAYDGWFTRAEKEVICCTVPWTRRVIERETTYRGKRIDLLEHLRSNRADFILKPNDDYGGHGVFFGNQSSQSEWEQSLSKALDEDYIAQEIIELRTEDFPIFDKRDWSIQPMFVDTNPFVFRGKVDGVMVRLSDSHLMNVTSGGGMTGFFVIEGEVAR